MQGVVRRLAVAGALVAAWSVAACAGPDPVDLFPHLDVARSVVTSGQVFPGKRAGDPELPIGWAGGDGDVVHVVDASADLVLQVAGPGDHRLEMEVQAPPSGMLLHAELEGTGAGTFPVPPGWNEIEVPLAEGHLRHGANRLRLDFTAVEGSALANPRIAVRRIRLVEPDGRTAWPDRPGSVERGEAPRTLRMPAGSAVDLVARAPAGSVVGGAARLQRPAGSRRASLRVFLEALGEDGEVLAAARHQVDEEGAFELTLEIPRRPRPVELPAARGDELLLRWRVEGPGNGTVVWDRLEIAGPGDAVVPAADGGRPLVAPRREAALGRRDVVLILLDAARADAVSAYGGHPETPAIDALADTRVEAVTAAAPWTAPSVASLMTGLYPDAHGLQAWDAGVPKSVRSLGESFAADGYRTVFFTQHPIWGAIPTLRRGFEVQLQVPETERHRLPTPTELFGENDDRRTFALIHLLLPHDPYEPPPPFRGRFTGDERGGQLAVDSETLHDLRRERPRRAQEPPPELPGYARARYDETMLWTDALLGELVATIDAGGRDPLIVLVSDHGEAFYEHGWFLHTRTVYEEMVAVPLLFRWPGDVAGARTQLDVGPISTIDVMPTLIDLLGLPYEGPGMQGRSLAPWLLDDAGTTATGADGADGADDRDATADADPASEPPGSAYAITTRVETGDAEEPLIAYRTGRYKAILDTRSGRVEAYDLEADPAETDDLARRRPLLAQWLLQGLLAQRHADLRIHAAWRDAGQTTELSPETIERLRALGYLQ